MLQLSTCLDIQSKKKSLFKYSLKMRFDNERYEMYTYTIII